MKHSVQGNRGDPEMELLCACLRPESPGVRVKEVLGRQPVSWPRFVALAQGHHVVPLASRALKAAAADGVPVPPVWLAQLSALRRSIVATNLRAVAELFRLQNRLAAQDIPLIPVKGPALAALAYGDMAIRQFEDLDLIVPREHLLRAVSWLEGDGYVLRELSSRVDRSWYADSLQGWSLEKPRSPPLDLKPVLISHVLCGADSAGFMRDACRPLPIDETRSLAAPGPEAMLLAVCLDGANEMWDKLSSVADAGALLAKYPDRDWVAFLQAAFHRGQRRTLLTGAALAAELLCAPLPEAFRNAMPSDPSAGRLARQAAERLRTLTPRHPSIVQQSGYAYRTRERWSDRLRFVVRLLWVPGAYDLAVLPLPGRWRFLSALLRPFRLAWDGRVRGGRERRLTLSAADGKVRSEAGSE